MGSRFFTKIERLWYFFSIANMLVFICLTMAVAGGFDFTTLSFAENLLDFYQYSILSIPLVLVYLAFTWKEHDPRWTNLAGLGITLIYVLQLLIIVILIKKQFH